MTYTEDEKQIFLTRHYNHTGLVKKYAERIVEHYPQLSELLEIVKYHDHTKLKDENIYWYIRFCLHNKNIKKMTNDEFVSYKKVRKQHGKDEKHHPDYYENHADIPLIYLCEMAADWCAVNEEKGTSPFDFYDKVVWNTLLLTNDQSKFLLRVLRKIWY